jgi:hypothetical protein
MTTTEQFPEDHVRNLQEGITKEKAMTNQNAVNEIVNRTGFDGASVFTRTGFPGRVSDGNPLRIPAGFGSQSRSEFVGG